MNIVVDKLPNSAFDCSFNYIGENNRVFCRLDNEICSLDNAAWGKKYGCPYLVTLKQAKPQEKPTYGITPKMFKERAQKIYDSGKGYAGEDGHLDMDQLMKECLDSLGYEEGTEILFSMKSIWYS